MTFNEYKIMPWVIIAIAFVLALVLIPFDPVMAITVFCMLTVIPLLNARILKWLNNDNSTTRNN